MARLGSILLKAGARANAAVTIATTAVSAVQIVVKLSKAAGRCRK